MGSSRFDVLWGKRGAVVKLAEIFEGERLRREKVAVAGDVELEALGGEW